MSDKKPTNDVALENVLPISDAIVIRPARTSCSAALARGLGLAWRVSLGTLAICEQQARRSFGQLRKSGKYAKQAEGKLAKRARRARVAASQMNGDRAGELIANNVERFLHRHDLASRDDFNRLQQQALKLSLAIAELKSRTAENSSGSDDEHFTLQ